MKLNVKAVMLWILGLLAFEAALGGILYFMGDATTAPRFTFLMFVLAVNFPGVLLASALGLLGHRWGLDSDPVAGWAVTFGFSVVLYGAFIWLVQAARGGGRSDSTQSVAAANLDRKESRGGGDG